MNSPETHFYQIATALHHDEWFTSPGVRFRPLVLY